MSQVTGYGRFAHRSQSHASSDEFARDLSARKLITPGAGGERADCYLSQR